MLARYVPRIITSKCQLLHQHTRTASCLALLQSSHRKDPTPASPHRSLLHNTPIIRTPQAFLSTDFQSARKNLPATDPEKGDLIYVGALVSHVRLVKLFSLSSSILCLAAQPYVVTQFENISLAARLALGGFFSIFILATPLLLNWVTLRYALRLYHDPKTGQYTVTTFNLFVQSKDFVFTRDDVKIPELPGALTTFEAKGKPFLVDFHLFRKAEDFDKLMKFDEEFNWQVTPKETDSKSES